MTENNAAQPVLTDTIQRVHDVLHKCRSMVSFHDQAFQEIGTAMKGLRALLSKLRTEGVQAGDELGKLPAYARSGQGQRCYSLGYARSRKKGNEEARSWPEDFAHENGNYMCKCHLCNHIFHGHKRRVTCKVCHVALANAPVADMLPLEKALYELVDKIAPGLDTGDLVQDARRASTALDAIMASAPVADAIQWPTMPPSKDQSSVLFDDGYAEGWAKCMEECRRAVLTASAPVADPEPTIVKLHAWGGQSDHHDYLMSDGNIKTLKSDEALAIGKARAPVAGEAQPVAFMVSTEMFSAHGPAMAYSKHVELPVVPLYAAPQASETDEDESATDTWRRLALQFDEHRMMAKHHIHMMLANPEIHAKAAQEFLDAPPLSGEQVLADRIAAIAKVQASEAYTYARNVAVTMWEKRFKQDAPEWKPCDDLIGVLTQIDNMVAGLVVPQASEAVRNAALEEAVNAVICSYAGKKLFAITRAIRALKAQADQDGVVDESPNLQGLPVDRSADLQGGGDCAKGARDAKPWVDLFWSVAKELNCLPSSFVDGNEHVLRAAREARAALAAQPAAQKQGDSDA